MWLAAKQTAHLTPTNKHRRRGKEEELLGMNSNQHHKSPGQPCIFLTKVSCYVCRHKRDLSVSYLDRKKA